MFDNFDQWIGRKLVDPSLRKAILVGNVHLPEIINAYTTEYPQDADPYARGMTAKATIGEVSIHFMVAEQLVTSDDISTQ